MARVSLWRWDDPCRAFQVLQENNGDYCEVDDVTIDKLAQSEQDSDSRGDLLDIAGDYFDTLSSTDSTSKSRTRCLK